MSCIEPCVAGARRGSPLTHARHFRQAIRSPIATCIEAAWRGCAHRLSRYNPHSMRYIHIEPIFIPASRRMPVPRGRRMMEREAPMTSSKVFCWSSYPLNEASPGTCSERTQHGASYAARRWDGGGAQQWIFRGALVGALERCAEKMSMALAQGCYGGGYRRRWRQRFSWAALLRSVDVMAAVGLRRTFATSVEGQASARLNPPATTPRARGSAFFMAVLPKRTRRRHHRVGPRSLSGCSGPGISARSVCLRGC